MKKLFSYKRILIVIFAVGILFTAAAAFAFQPNPKAQLIGPNGVVYSALVPTVESMGYQVRQTKAAGGTTKDGQPITEYYYTVKNGEKMIGGLSFGICDKGIVWQMGDQAFATLDQYTDSDLFLLQDGTLYVPDDFIGTLIDWNGEIEPTVA